jgi:PAS domain S-box-containing protein
VYLVDTSGICVYVNPAVGEMLGHDVEALVGTDIHSVIHLERKWARQPVPPRGTGTRMRILR